MSSKPNSFRQSDVTTEKIALSIVIPLYNEQQVFAQLEQRLLSTMDQAEFVCETILVDDGSSDRTSELIAAACERDPRFRGVVLSRNFGHQRAVSAGLDYSRGAAVGVLDGDLQDPPELLLEFYKKYQAGYDVVCAVRKNRKEGPFKRFCYWAFYRLMQRLATIEIPLDSGDFCLMSRRVVDRICELPERHRFIRGLRSWVGFKQVAVEYDRSARTAGESKYTLSKLVCLALDGLFTFSEAPLRLATVAGASVASIAFMFAAYVIGWRMLHPAFVLPGFATLSCGMFFLGGIQLLGLGILGEYVARIHNEVKARPIYIVDKVIESKPCETEPGWDEAELDESGEAEELQLERDIKSLLPNLIFDTEVSVHVPTT